jgi:surface antigen
MKTASTASLVHLNDVVCLTVSNNISHMDDFEQRFNILQNKVNNAHRHTPNSAKKVKQRAGPEQWLKKLKSCTTLVAHVSYLKSFATS